MKLVTPSALALVLALAACGGKSKSTTAVGNAAGGGASLAPIPAGIHGCHFIVEGNTFGNHRCDVGPGTLEKASGMETFKATLTPADGGLDVAGAMGCDDLVDKCNQPFSAHLTNQDGTWRGEVTPTDGEQRWWLAGATFELDDAAGYGGATYGEAWDRPAGP